MGEGIAAAVAWIASNAGAIASVASVGAAVYSATQTSSPATIGDVNTNTVIDKTTTDAAAELDAAKIGQDGTGKSGAKSKFKVDRTTTPTTTGTNISGSPSIGVQI